MAGGKSKTTVTDTTPGYIHDQNKANIALANEIAARPYKQYEGQRIADLLPGQREAISGFVKTGAMGQGLAQRGFDILGGLGTADQRLSAYYNPYEQQVLDRSMNDLERQRQMALQQTAGQSLANKAYGGSRQAVRDALTNEAFAKQAADTAANLRYQGFNTALGAAQADLAQQQGLAQALGQAGYGAMQGSIDAGNFLRGFDQSKLDLDYQNFLEKENYDLFRLGLLQSAVQNAPFQSTASQSQSPDRLGQGIQAGALVGAAFL